MMYHHNRSENRSYDDYSGYHTDNHVSRYRQRLVDGGAMVDPVKIEKTSLILEMGNRQHRG